MTSLRFHPAAEAELQQAIVYYSDRNRRSASEFAGAIEDALTFVLSNPSACASVRGPLRRWFVRRFPYYILFRHEDDQIYILAVAHQRQRPGYWEDRA